MPKQVLACFGKTPGSIKAAMRRQLLLLLQR
jgi:hypothetical protein